MLKTRKPEFTSEEAAAAVLVVWLVTKHKLLRFVRAENN